MDIAKVLSEQLPLAPHDDVEMITASMLGGMHSYKSHCSDHELRDFWIVVNVELQQIKVCFCERYPHHHANVFECLLELIQKECHVINQELLLEKMQSTNECDSLLIESDVIPSKFMRPTSRETIPDTKLKRSLVHKRSGTRTKQNVSFSYADSDDEEVEIIPYTSARVVYPAGHFACPIVAHYWFYIHPRLHTKLRGKGCSQWSQQARDRNGWRSDLREWRKTGRRVGTNVRLCSASPFRAIIINTGYIPSFSSLANRDSIAENKTGNATSDKVIRGRDLTKEHKKGKKVSQGQRMDPPEQNASGHLVKAATRKMNPFFTTFKERKIKKSGIISVSLMLIILTLLFVVFVMLIVR